ncbi:MAG: putative DNA-binding domain-containing protein [Pseudomonadota bacterium]
MAKRPAFQETQYAFAAHLRDPQNVAAPDGIEDRRLQIYRELFFNNLRNLLARTYPVLKRLHSDQQWNRFIRGFMQKHEAHTPYFLQLPSEFLAFLQNEYEPRNDDFPFLVELAHYEYIELALSVSDTENDLTGIDPNGDLLTGIPVKSELAWVYAYSFPVHRITNDFIPTEPDAQPHYFAVVRNHEDKVRFHELNPVTAGLLNAIEENHSGKPGEQLLRDLAVTIGFGDAEQFLAHGRAALNEFQSKEIILGARAPD